MDGQGNRVRLEDLFPDGASSTPSVSAGGSNRVSLESLQSNGMAAAPSTSPGGGKFLSNAPEDETSDWSAIGKGAATAGIKGVAGVPGMIGDIRQLRDYLGARLYSAVAGGKPEEALNTINQFRKEHPILSRVVEGPISTLPTTEEIAAPILERTGEYKPTSLPGKAAMAGVQAATTGALTGGLGTLGAGVSAGRTGASLLAPAATSAARAIPGAAASGAGAETVTELTEEPLLGLLAGLAIPEAGKLASPAFKYARPAKAGVSGETAKDIAAEQFAGATQNREKALADLSFQQREMVSGAPATTAQLTQDPGHAALQKSLETASPEFKARMQGVSGERNVALREAEASLGPPEANLMAPSQIIQKRVNEINAQTDRQIADLQRQADELHGNLPAGVRPEEVGAALRSAIIDARDEARKAVNAAYKVVPDDTNAVAIPISKGANQILESISPYAKKIDPETAEILNVARSFPETISFKDLREFDTRVTDAMRSAKRNPELANEHRLLTDLKGSVINAIDNAAEHQEAYVPPAGATALPNLTPEGAAALGRAKSLYKDYASTYKTGPVAEILKTNGGAEDFRTFASGLPNRVFREGNTGYENARAFLAAGKNQPAAVAAMRDIANNSLRDTIQNAGGTLTQKALNTWKNKFRESLRAIEEVDSGYTNRFNNVASATEALSAARSQAAAARTNKLIEPVKNLLGASSEDAVVGHVGSMLKSKEGAGQIRDVIQATGNDSAAIDGLRRAGARWLVDSTANAGIEGGVPVVSGAKLRDVLKNNSDALETLFGKDGMNTLRQMAVDSERAQGVSSLKAVSGGSDTAANIISALKTNAGRMTDKGVSGLMFLTALDGLRSGSLSYALLSSSIAGAKGLGDALRSRGMSRVNDLIEEALVNPDLARELLQRSKSNKDADIGTQLEKMSRRIARIGIVGPQQVPKEGQGEEARPLTIHRATGGKVGSEGHGQIAARLVRMVDQAKKAEDSNTKELLNEPDEAVVKALHVAQQAI